MIIDASTLILLAKCGLLDLLIGNLKSGLVIPEKVKIESTAKEDAFDAKLIRERIKEDKIIVKKIKDFARYKKLMMNFNLGEGESEAIALSLQEKESLMTDDKNAMNVCRILNINFTTALNILAEMHKRKLISQQQANLMLDKLNEYGRYSEDLIRKVKEDLGG